MRAARTARPLALAALLAFAGCQGSADKLPPSLLLVVVDTLRFDAVSAYGAIAGTTPAIDALAADGLLYQRAYAPAPWTLPSHASLFSGLEPEGHGVGLRGRTILPERVVTLAERLKAHGYDSFGLSENPLVSNAFKLGQGFDRFEARSVEDLVREQLRGERPRFDVIAGLAEWLARRSSERPFFAFVNLFEPHEPYTLRESNPFLPEDARPEVVRLATEPPPTSFRICARLPSPSELSVLRGLYLGDVAEADRRLGELQRLAAASAERLTTVVTSDHGEHLGEQRLMDHEFSVWDSALHVPLVVHGLPQVAPARIAAPVALVDVTTSLLAWAGVAPSGSLAGRPLPTTDAADSPVERPLFALYSDRDYRLPPARDVGIAIQEVRDRKREGCAEHHRVFGDRVALLRYPLKLVWYERYPVELYHLGDDPGERIDLVAARPELAERLAREAREFVARVGLLEQAEDPNALPREAADALRQLGYAE